MFAASWFRLSKHVLNAVLSRPVRHNSSRRPTHPRPTLEYLEERVVPDAATTSNTLGPLNNASSFSASNTQQSSIVVTPANNNSQLSGLAIGAFPNASSSNAVGLALGAFASPLLQGQLYAQFSVLGINAVGQGGLGFQNNLPNFLQNSFGFGSGAQPTQPWVPNAYNLGLANQQSAFPSMADRGFQAPAPWIRQIAHRGEQLDADDEGPAPHTFLAVKDFTSDENQTDEFAVDEDAGAPVEEQMVPRSDPETSTISDTPNAALQMEREEIADKLFLPTSKPDNSEAVTPRFARTHAALPGEENALTSEKDRKEVPPLHSLNLPSTLLLSVLTPAQLTALVMEFPAFAAPRNDRAKEERLEELE